MQAIAKNIISISSFLFLYLSLFYSHSIQIFTLQASFYISLHFCLYSTLSLSLSWQHESLIPPLSISLRLPKTPVCHTKSQNFRLLLLFWLFSPYYFAKRWRWLPVNGEKILCFEENNILLQSDSIFYVDFNATHAYVQ